MKIRTSSTVAALAFLLATGCTASTITGRGPYTAEKGDTTTPPGAVRYHLAKTVVTVEAKVTYRATGSIGFTADFQPNRVLKPVRSTAQVQIITVPDQTQFYTLQLEPGDGDSSELVVETQSNGLLKGVNLRSTSQSGEILKSTMQVVSIVAAALPFVLADGDQAQRTAAATFVCGKFVEDLTGSSAQVADPCTTLTPALRKSVQSRSMASLYFLAKEEEGRVLWRRGVELDEIITTRMDERRTLEAKVTREAKGELEGLKTRLGLVTAALDAGMAERARVTASLDGLVQKFMKQQGLDGREYELTIKKQFELADLPLAGSFHDGMTEGEARTALANHGAMLDLFDVAGIVITVDAAPKVSSFGENAASGDDTARIHYRRARAAQVSTYGLGPSVVNVSSGEDPKTVVRLQDTRIEHVVEPSAPVLTFSFEPEEFAERKLELAFDERGQPVKVGRSGSSAVAGATGAVAGGIAQARNEYADTLDKMSKNEEAKRKLAQAEVTAEIERLNKQKDLVNARLDLTGAQANAEAIAEKRRIDAQIELLKSQKLLAQETLGTTSP
ncbi:hypothetical protein [Sorangium sp. So ce341]|uniref:hypothetical protein n=1 Tax=Sorangium sp. So ce341 TaxID=3133302 RepID=UPI003F5D93C5